MVAMHANNNDPRWATLAFSDVAMGAASGSTTGRRRFIELDDLEVTVDRTEYIMRTFSRTYRGSIQLERDDVLAFLADDDLAGLEDLIRDTIENEYTGWSEDDGDVDEDVTDSEESITDSPDAGALASDLQDEYGEPEEEEE